MQHPSSLTKRLRACAISGAMALTALAAPLSATAPVASAADTDNYAKLLQYTMYFYDANMCGSKVGETSAMTWRDDCHTGDGVDGGFHDAGDHAIFGLPQGYTASTLGWGYYEFGDVYDSLGLTSHYKTLADYFCTFFKNSTKLSGSSVSNFCYQLGDGNVDHSYWGAPEVQENQQGKQKEYWTTSTGSDIAAEYAAALALNYINFGNQEDLTYAKALLNYATSTNSCATDGPTGFYGSDDYKDDIAWAAGWLYLATNDNAYLNTMNSYIAQYIGWVHCWNNVTLGAHIVKAHITDNWSEVNNYLSQKTNSSSYYFQDGWGSCRYNTAMQLCALSATKNSSADYSAWCKGQMSYILGSNPANTCFVVGFASNSSKYPHHRAASGWDNWDGFNNSNGLYASDGHVLIGALVGGPTNEGGAYVDSVKDFQANEVACDYNAAIVGAAAGLYSIYKTGSCDTSIEGVKPFTLDVVGETTTTTTTTETTTTTTTTESTTTTTTTTTTSTETLDVLLGDVNGDGRLDIADVVMLARYVSQDNSLDRSLVHLQNCNISQDTQVNADDISALSAILAGL